MNLHAFDSPLCTVFAISDVAILNCLAVAASFFDVVNSATKGQAHQLQFQSSQGHLESMRKIRSFKRAKQAIYPTDHDFPGKSLRPKSKPNLNDKYPQLKSPAWTDAP